MNRGKTMRKLAMLAAFALSTAAVFCQKTIRWEGLEFICPAETTCSAWKDGKTTVLQEGTDASRSMEISVRSVQQFTHELDPQEADDGGKAFKRIYGGNKKKLLNAITSGSFNFAMDFMQARKSGASAIRIQGKPAGSYGYFTQTECYSLAKFGSYSLYLTDGKKVYHILFNNKLPATELAPSLPAYCSYLEKGPIGPGYYWREEDGVQLFFSDLKEQKPALPVEFRRYQQAWESLLASLRFVK